MLVSCASDLQARTWSQHTSGSPWRDRYQGDKGKAAKREKGGQGCKGGRRGQGEENDKKGDDDDNKDDNEMTMSNNEGMITRGHVVELKAWRKAEIQDSEPTDQEIQNVEPTDQPSPWEACRK